jgi:translation initiation factor 2D
MRNYYGFLRILTDLRRKGSLSPIQVTIKVRQGRKASTLITGFEPFLVIDAEEMAEDLRKVCAGATSGNIVCYLGHKSTLQLEFFFCWLVSPMLGKPANSSLEVLVQGKQSQAVVDYLTSKGIPKKWIEVSDLSGKK